MSDARVIDVVEAALALITSTVNGNGYVINGWVPLFDPRPEFPQAGSGTTPHVWVVPAGTTTAPLSRNTVEELVKIDVGVLQYLDPAAAAYLANFRNAMRLVEQVKQTLEAPLALVLADAPTDCGWQGTENDPIYDPDRLRQNSQFFSVATLAFLTRRGR